MSATLENTNRKPLEPSSTDEVPFNAGSLYRFHIEGCGDQSRLSQVTVFSQDAVLENVAKCAVSGRIVSRDFRSGVFLIAENEIWRELKLLKAVIGLSKLAANWNQFGAEPLNTAILNDAVRFVEEYVPEMQGLPRVVPMTRGRLQFEWSSDGRALELEFEEPGKLHYLLCRGIDETEDVIDSSDRESILALLRSYFSPGE